MNRRANTYLGKSTRKQQMEEVKGREENDATSTSEVVMSFLKGVPENHSQDILNANVCSGVKGDELDKQTVDNRMNGILKQAFKRNYTDDQLISSLLDEMRNDNDVSAGALAGHLSRRNLLPAVRQQTDRLCVEVVTQSTVPEYTSLSLKQGDSNSHEFWEERNNNWECSCGECDDNSDSNNNINRELPRQLMPVPVERALSPQTPPKDTVQDRVCSQQSSAERSETMDGSVDDNLKMFMLHLDISALHDNIDDTDYMTVSQAQRDYGCHNLRECNNLGIKDTSVTEAPLSPSAYHNSGISRASSNTDEPPLPPVQQDLYKKHSEDDCNYHMKQLAMKIQGLKKKIKSFEESFEVDYGYKPSQGEKVGQPHIKKYMSKLARARKDLKRLKEDAENGNRSKNGNNGSSFDARHPMAMSVGSILRSLAEKRQVAGKTENRRVSTVLELQTVPEDETMEIPVSFSRYSTQEELYLHGGEAESLSDVFAKQEMPNNLDVSGTHLKQGDQSCKDSSFRALDTGGDSRLHEMSLPELWREIECSRVQKGRLGRAIREFEHDFFVKTGRKVRKENRFPLQCEYSEYKKVKGRLRLLEALMLKHCE